MVAFLHKILRFAENFRVNSVFKKKKKELCIFCRELDTGNFLLLYLQISIKQISCRFSKEDFIVCQVDNRANCQKRECRKSTNWNGKLQG